MAGSGLEPDFLQGLASRAKDARDRHANRGTAPCSHSAALRDLAAAREGLAVSMSKQQWPQQRTPNTMAMAGIAHASSRRGSSNSSVSAVSSSRRGAAGLGDAATAATPSSASHAHLPPSQRPRRRSTVVAGQALALNSVAMQANTMRNLGMKQPLSLVMHSGRQRGRGTRRQQAAAAAQLPVPPPQQLQRQYVREQRRQLEQVAAAAVAARGHEEEAAGGVGRAGAQWSCSRCTLRNHGAVSLCGACGVARPAATAAAAGGGSSVLADPELQLAVAAKLALALEPAAAPLTEAEWRGCERQAEARQDLATQPCSICMEQLASAAQTMLSCSHVFHSACLASFERYVCAGRRTCPVCRKEHYEKRQIEQGALAVNDGAARVIQALLRGWMTRRRFRRELARYYAEGGGEAGRRHGFFAQRIGGVSDRLLAALDERQDSVDSLLAQLDDSVANSRATFDRADAAVARAAAGGGGSDWRGLAAEQRSAAAAATTTSAALPPLPRTDWAAVMECAVVRAEPSCPICMNRVSLDPPSSGATRRPVALLSCSHVFHASCITAFEKFNILDTCQCPVCRERYESKVL